MVTSPERRAPLARYCVAQIQEAEWYTGDIARSLTQFLNKIADF
jgi:hypothetical protein